MIHVTDNQEGPIVFGSNPLDSRRKDLLPLVVSGDRRVFNATMSHVFRGWKNPRVQMLFPIGT